MKDQTDKIILESLNYSKRMLASTISVILFIIGTTLIISPLFLASQSYIWILGIAVLAIAVLYTCMRKKGYSVKQSNKAVYIAALILQCAALVLEILPIGAVMVFATSPTERTIEICSYFSLLPVGYANITPMLTGILTVAIILLGVMILFRFDKAKKFKKTAFICSIFSLLLSIVPLFLFGIIGMTAASYVISAAIFCQSVYKLWQIGKNDLRRFSTSSVKMNLTHSRRAEQHELTSALQGRDCCLLIQKISNFYSFCNLRQKKRTYRMKGLSVHSEEVNAWMTCR